MLPKAIAASPVIERSWADTLLRKSRIGNPKVIAINLKIGEMKKSSHITVQLVFPFNASIRNKTLKIKPRNNIECVPMVMEIPIRIIAGINS